MLISINSGIHSARPDGIRFDMTEMPDVLADAGFECIDANFCASIYKDLPNKIWEPILDGDEKEWKARVARIGERAAARGLPIRLSHLPYFKYADRSDPELREFRYEMIRRSAEAAGMLGISWTVLHVGKTVDATLEFARDICRTVNGYGVGVAVENSPKSTIDVLCESVDTLAAERYNVGICFDTGHGHLTGASQGEMLDKIGSRLRMLHIHDNHGEKDEHREIGCGTIDWDDVMTSLARIGYDGDFNYEINSANIPVEGRAEYYRSLVAAARPLVDKFEAARRSINR
ncbi:MAG: sugar phosphate isomerase/epimerase [Clostridia bacterium]|nr:sugar phosphate isomerase/epimerase [Clostridia bacterium]